MNSLSKISIHALLSEPSPIEKSLRQAWLGECLQVGLGYFITHADDEVAAAMVTTYRDGIKKLEQGTPLAYVIGRQGFWRHEFMVNEHTLIPRPDTETLIETVLTLTKNSLSTENQSLQLLDLGTGSGCIAISLAAEKPMWQVTATDFSADALTVANANAQRIGVDNIQFKQGSWYKALDSVQTFDVIVSNPPYIDSNDAHLAGLTAEPITALVADNQGLADIDAIVQGSGDWLRPNGLLAIEHGYAQGSAVRQIFEQAGFDQVTTVKDFGGNDRVTYGFSL